MSEELNDIDARRVCWHSRRGMLELDVILVPFAENKYLGLAEDDKRRYRDLLECEDPDLFAWFMEHQDPENADFQRIVAVVLEYARSPK